MAAEVRMPCHRSSLRTNASRAATNTGRMVDRKTTPPPDLIVPTSSRPDPVDDPPRPRRARQPGGEPCVAAAEDGVADVLVRVRQQQDVAAEAHLERADRREARVRGR